MAQIHGDLHMLKPCCSFHGGLWISSMPCFMFSNCALSENPKVLNIPVYQKKYSNLHRLDRFCLLRKGDACHVIMFFSLHFMVFVDLHRKCVPHLFGGLHMFKQVCALQGCQLILCLLLTIR